MRRSTQACTERDIVRLLVDITELQGYAPTTMERHDIGVTGASLSRNLEKVAVILCPKQNNSDMFSTTVARNRGLSVQAFVDREEALRWLLGAASGRTKPQV
jgi:hypothetical protein